ncbi:uncharacterized protein DUF4263 [Saccharopolyspora erythraea NRRL 2338]|uniref:Shedu protein SduA C-terminal domain-containing protein n=1 Tax=Saccharopolyspora erythraea TaxID=1836 RepID=A0ABN1D3H1_SACER|nr:Shedu anti-phage system protein SduA domain-containing protein [Saccharopolyspora erythraea]PFG94269.1 uncharacterized protein DUF4263 [Saccharopolyspora erythraea NRRL 2338]
MGDDIFDRRQAAAESLSYSDPITLRAGSRTHFELIPRYITRSESRIEVSLKVRYWKKNDSGLQVGYPVDFTLNNDEFLQLREELQKIAAISSQPENGRYFVFRADEDGDSERSIDVHTLGNLIRKISQDDGSLKRLAADPDGEHLIRSIQLSARSADLRQALEDLNRMLDASADHPESDFQRWMERHAWALGDEYRSLDEVRSIGNRESVDMMLENSLDGLRDIVELKTPRMEPIIWDSSHKSWYWSSDSSKAIGQCHRYLDKLHESAKKGMDDYENIVAYYPRATIVIGRSQGKDLNWFKGLRGLNARLHSIQVITYDQMAARAKRRLDILEKDQSSREGSE